MTQDVLEEGRDKRRVFVSSPSRCFEQKPIFYRSGVYAAIASFLTFSMLQFRDGPFIRPHPAFWRVVLGVNLLYELVMVFLLFQDLGSARKMMTYIDSGLGVPLPEKSYAEDCSLTPKALWVGGDHPLL
jgi:phosphatidylserine synthase 2